nr:lysophospholipid acyltransferase family protein [uncultured Desulfuromonas sp.]
MNKETLQNYLEAAPFFLFVAIARLLPRLWALKLGRQLGRVSRFFQPQRVATARDNLRRAYPDKDSAWIETMIRKVFEHLGISSMEMLRLNHFTTRRDVEAHFTFEGMEHLQALKEQQQGAFLLTGHVGFWEAGTFFMPILGYPVDFVAKKIRNPFVDRFIQKQREGAGGRCLDSKKGARRIIRALADQRMVCLLLDQHISKKQAVVVNFFDRPAYATPIIPQIALKNQTPIVPVFVYRQEDYNYRVVVHPPLVFDGPAGKEAIQACTQKLTDVVEEAIRLQPDQWFWVHRRWRKSAERQTS